MRWCLEFWWEWCKWMCRHIEFISTFLMQWKTNHVPLKTIYYQLKCMHRLNWKKKSNNDSFQNGFTLHSWSAVFSTSNRTKKKWSKQNKYKKQVEKKHNREQSEQEHYMHIVAWEATMRYSSSARMKCIISDWFKKLLLWATTQEDPYNLRYDWVYSWESFIVWRVNVVQINALVCVYIKHTVAAVLRLSHSGLVTPKNLTF